MICTIIWLEYYRAIVICIGNQSKSPLPSSSNWFFLRNGIESHWYHPGFVCIFIGEWSCYQWQRWSYTILGAHFISLNFSPSTTSKHIIRDGLSKEVPETKTLWPGGKLLPLTQKAPTLLSFGSITWLRFSLNFPQIWGGTNATCVTMHPFSPTLWMSLWDGESFNRACWWLGFYGDRRVRESGVR